MEQRTVGVSRMSPSLVSLPEDILLSLPLYLRDIEDFVVMKVPSQVQLCRCSNRTAGSTTNLLLEQCLLPFGDILGGILQI